MAYLLWKNDRAYIYHKGKCREALGVIGSRDAEVELNKWKVDNGAGDEPISDMSIAVVWNNYLRWMVQEGYSETTIKHLKNCLPQFLKHVTTLQDLTSSKIKWWDGHLSEKIVSFKNTPSRPLSTESRAQQLRCLRAFCGWLVKQNYIYTNPFKIKIPPQRKDAGRALSGAEVHSLFEAWPMRHKTSQLSKLFFQFMFYGGTRVSEILGYNEDCVGAKYENIDRQKWIIKLDRTKGGTAREVALPEWLIKSIPDGVGPIFFGRIGYTALWDHLREAAKIAGIQGRVRIYDARVSAATEFARKNRHPKSMMDQFGWKSEKMALHYTKVATEERVAHVQNMTYL
jgi:integrase